MDGITKVLPSVETHPEFGAFLDEEVKAGEKIKI